jgi:drug/metabolite transporter (DMT)-like permease
MSALNIGLLLAYSAGMSVGQLLFKLAADSAFGAAKQAGAASQMVRLVLDPFFLGAISMYFALSVMWVWILSFTPLSRAYPFVAAAFIVTPLLSHLFFHEPLDLRFALGLVFIVVGLMLIVGRQA